MAEMKNKRSQKKMMPTVDRWLIDLEAEETPETEIDPYGGRFFGDQVDDDSDDGDFDRYGGGLFSF